MLLILAVVVLILLSLLFTSDSAGNEDTYSPDAQYTPYSELFLRSVYIPYSYTLLAKNDACWNELIMRESGWRVDATNATSGAFGLPQSLPANKMATAGDDWRINPETQLKWMYKYMEVRYNGSCNALNFQIKNNWY